jgi:hypothetical protein
MLVEHGDKKIKVPDFLIVGAAKSGTTSLYYYLKQHPQIFMPRVKEPWFFSFKNNPPSNVNHNPLQGVTWKLEDYIKLFEEAKQNQLMGEASPSYLYTYNTAIKNIKELYAEDYKKLKIIMILRNPIERVFSQFMMFKRENTEPLGFMEAISPDTIRERMEGNWNLFYDYIGFGFSHDPVKAYLDQFPKVKVFIYEELVEDQNEVMKDICEFLNIEVLNISDNIRHNISGVPRVKFIHNIMTNPAFKDFIKSFVPEDKRRKIKSIILSFNIKKVTIDKEAEAYLASVFKDDIERLGVLLGRDLSSWYRLG